MKKGATFITVLIALLLGVSAVFADSLVQVYQQALVNDPAFRKAQADWLTAKENFPLALTGNGAAGSGLFPNLAASAFFNEDYTKLTNSAGANHGNFESKGYALTLTQPIFNLATWYSIGSALYGVRSATATYLAAAQDLMRRTADAYFEVLRANARLTLTLAQKKQFLHQLVTSEQKFRVGLIAITGVYDAQSSYDRSIADEIKNRNLLQDALEDLRAITGIKYKALTDLRAKIPLVVPSPNSITEWVRVALKQNYVIQADLNNMFAARENVKVAAVGNLPTINLVGSYGQSRSGGVNQPPIAANSPFNTLDTTIDSASVGLQLNFPVFRGGFDIANTKQTRYQYLSSSDQLAIDHRTVENQTRKAFLGIDSGISQIQADQQTIISARNQLAATQAGYIVGTRTMVDVLDSVTTLTQAQLAYADDRYDYVEGIVLLKQQAGILSPNDLKQLTNWLRPRVKFSLQQPTVKIRPTPKGAPQVKADLLDLNDPKYTDPGVSEEVAKTPSSLKIENNAKKEVDEQINKEVNSQQGEIPYVTPQIKPSTRIELPSSLDASSRRSSIPAQSIDQSKVSEPNATPLKEQVKSNSVSTTHSSAIKAKKSRSTLPAATTQPTTPGSTSELPAPEEETTPTLQKSPQL